MVAASGKAPGVIVRPRRIAGLAAVLALGGGLALWSGEVPRWTLRGAAMVLPEPLPPVVAGPIAVPAEGTILFVGDSNTAGTRIGGAAAAYPAVFAASFGMDARIRVTAFGGATVADMLDRKVAGPAVLAFIMLGTNDAATRGPLSDRLPVPQEAYKRRLSTLVRRLKTDGAQVVILAPPPVGTRAMARRLQPYRMAARDVAQATASRFRDPASAFVSPAEPGLLHFDALHLSPEAQRNLGLWLAGQTVNASSPDSSSTGKPSPASASQPS